VDVSDARGPARNRSGDFSLSCDALGLIVAGQASASAQGPASQDSAGGALSASGSPTPASPIEIVLRGPSRLPGDPRQAITLALAGLLLVLLILGLLLRRARLRR
jgi:hypothetical protein